MRKRHEILREAGADDDEVTDQVLAGQVAFIVFQQAIESIPGNA